VHVLFPWVHFLLNCLPDRLVADGLLLGWLSRCRFPRRTCHWSANLKLFSFLWHSFSAVLSAATLAPAPEEPFVAPHTLSPVFVVAGGLRSAKGCFTALPFLFPSSFLSSLPFLDFAAQPSPSGFPLVPPPLFFGFILLLVKRETSFVGYFFLPSFPPLPLLVVGRTKAELPLFLLFFSGTARLSDRGSFLENAIFPVGPVKSDVCCMSNVQTNVLPGFFPGLLFPACRRTDFTVMFSSIPPLTPWLRPQYICFP